VYVGGASGFSSTSTSWSVPDAKFYALASAASTGTWATVDVTGDGRVDLVETEDVQTGQAFGGAASPHWNVYAGGASGFSSTASSWSVPDVKLYALASERSTGTWATLDLDADGCVDLVDTEDPNTGNAYAGPVWHVYRGQ
jgi:hypothetical protein